MMMHSGVLLIGKVAYLKLSIPQCWKATPGDGQKASEVHRQDLLHEAENERLLKQLPLNNRNMIKNAAGKLSILLLKLGARLQQIEQSATMLEDPL